MTDLTVTRGDARAGSRGWPNSRLLRAAGRLQGGVLLRRPGGDDARGRRDLGVRRVLPDEDHVAVADPVDPPVEGDVAAGRPAGVNDLGLAHEVADLGHEAEAVGIGEERAR